MINQKMLTVLTILFLLFTTHSPKPPDISSLDPPNPKANSNKSKSPIDNIDLFLPKWTYNTNNSPFHLSKDLQKVYPNLQNGSNAKRLYILSNDLIEKLEKKREQQRLSEIIQKEINLDMTKINKNIPIYVYPEIKKAIKRRNQKDTMLQLNPSISTLDVKSSEKKPTAPVVENLNERPDLLPEEIYMPENRLSYKR